MKDLVKVGELCFAAFVEIGYILRTPEPQEKGAPLKGNDRSEDFIFELYRQIVASLSDLPEDYYYNDTFIELAIDGIVEQYDELVKLLNAEPDFSLLNTDEFQIEIDGKSEVIRFDGFDKWAFNKWVTFENAMKGQTDTDENGDEFQVSGGELNVLPICFGEWFDDMPLYRQKFELLNYSLPARDVIPVFGRVNGLVNELKKRYAFIYSEAMGEDEKDAPKAFKLHVDLFGWQETLRDLAEKKVFGDYLKTKAAPALQVLEYLNCAVSKETARQEDFLSQQSKKQ